MYYYEDFEVGETHQTSSRTVSESDISTFVELCGLFEPLFIDIEHVKSETPFDRRFAPGEMTLSFALGNFARSGLADAALAMLDVQANYPNPVLADDTISVEVTIADKQETSNPEQGIVDFDLEVTNQNGEVVAEIVEKTLVQRRPE